MSQLISIKKTEDQIALIKAMASRDPQVAYEARAAVADLVGPVISQVINNAPTITNLYQTLVFGEDENPSIQLDAFHDISDEQYLRVTSQSAPGGLATNELFPAHDELKFKTYSLDSAFALDEKYARRCRLDIVSAAFSRMAQEFLLKQEKTAVNELIYAALSADTNYGSGSAAGNHFTTATNASQFTLDDFNKLITRSKRLWSSFSGGTPTSGIKVGVTDLIMSPEIVQEIRSMAYQPVNTRAVPNTDESTAVPAPDSMREQLMNAGGLPTLFGIGIIEILEMGINQRYNKIFNAINTDLSSAVSFTQANDEFVLGIMANAPGLWRPAIREEGVSTEVSLRPDDQFTGRSRKMGFWGNIEEGRTITDSRLLTGVIV